ncbi:MAG: DUF2400 family protein [Bacteroides sp.]|nr:MAG: DUF2400 family protein [Bacteroides sp.]
MKNAINYFKQYFIDHKMDLYKYISSPNEKSACKKINMFLRWMVRKDSKNIDFGIWNKINPQDLICPIDIHVGNAARNLHLIKDNKYNNWNAAEELTSNLKMINKSDPIKYDIVLFTISKENIIIS